MLRHACLLALIPVVALSQEPARTAAPDKPLLVSPAAEIREVAREVVRNRAPEEKAATVDAADAVPVSPVRAALALSPPPLRARPVPVRYECLLHDCKAYDADGTILYSEPRKTIAGADKLTENQWLACQSGDDMLSTFERLDQCRGAGLLIAAPWDKALFRVPLTGHD